MNNLSSFTSHQNGETIKSVPTIVIRNNMSHEKKEPGRPRLHKNQDVAMDNYNARLTAWHARMARKIGDGTLSQGVRICIEFTIKNRK